MHLRAAALALLVGATAADPSTWEVLLNIFKSYVETTRFAKASEDTVDDRSVNGNVASTPLSLDAKKCHKRCGNDMVCHHACPKILPTGGHTRKDHHGKHKRDDGRHDDEDQGRTNHDNHVSHRHRFRSQFSHSERTHNHSHVWNHSSHARNYSHGDDSTSIWECSENCGEDATCLEKCPRPWLETKQFCEMFRALSECHLQCKDESKCQEKCPLLPDKIAAAKVKTVLTCHRDCSSRQDESCHNACGIPMKHMTTTCDLLEDAQGRNRRLGRNSNQVESSHHGLDHQDYGIENDHGDRHGEEDHRDSHDGYNHETVAELPRRVPDVDFLV